jgi:hypothetical protein
MRSPWTTIASRLGPYFQLVAQPSWPSTIVASAIVALFVTALFALPPRSLDTALSLYPGYNRLPENYYIFHKLTEELKEPTGAGELKIVLVGGSTTRESLWSEQSLEQSLEQKLGRAVSVVDLASSGQTLVTSWVLTEKALCNGADIAVLGLSVARLGLGGSGPNPLMKYGYGSATLTPVLASLDTLDDFYLSGRYHQFNLASMHLAGLYLVYDVTGIRANAVRPAPWVNRHVYIGPRPTEAAMQRRLDRAVAAHVQQFGRRHEQGKAMVRNMIALGKSCGGKVVILDTPMNPVLQDSSQWPGYAQAYATYRGFLKELESRDGVPVILPRDAGAYGTEDFVDFGHLRTTTSIQAVTAHMSERLVHIAATRQAGP